MASADNNSPTGTAPSGPSRRRSSFTGQIVDMFGRTQASGTSAYPGPIATAAAQANQRRLSLSTVGLSGSPNQPSPFTPGQRPRAGSISSSNSGTVDESPFEDSDVPAGSAPTTPFARRLSFGARAMRDMRSAGGNGNGNARPSVSNAQKPPSPAAATASYGRGLSLLMPTSSFPDAPVVPRRHIEHSLLTKDFQAGSAKYDFTENMRLRAERSSISAASGPPQFLGMHPRSKSMAAADAPAPREMPRQPNVPDPIQERILRGDFYMD